VCFDALRVQAIGPAMREESVPITMKMHGTYRPGAAFLLQLHFLAAIFNVEDFLRADRRPGVCPASRRRCAAAGTRGITAGTAGAGFFLLHFPVGTRAFLVAVVISFNLPLGDGPSRLEFPGLESSRMIFSVSSIVAVM